MPKVSVCIACYNHQNFIKEAINSVLAQTFQDFEIIVLNNGSSDNSLEVIKSIKDERIKVFSIEKNLQSTYAGNFCISKAKGDYIALLCSDDFWQETKLEKQVEFLDKNPDYGAVFTRCRIVDKNSKEISDKKNPYNLQFNLEENKTRFLWLKSIWNNAQHNFCCSSALIRKNVLENKDEAFDLRLKYIQDMDLWTRILTKSEVKIIDEKLTSMRYFRKGTNLSASSLKNSLSVIIEANILYNSFKKIDNLKDFLKVFPEVKDKFNIIEEKFIPFYLAILTLKYSSVVHFKQSALNHLYEILGNLNFRKELEESLNFNHMDLYKISDEFYLEIFENNILKRFKNIFSLIFRHK